MVLMRIDHFIFVVLIHRCDIMDDGLECLLTQRTLWLDLKWEQWDSFVIVLNVITNVNTMLRHFSLIVVKFRFYFLLTLLHSSKQLKQNWCMHESVKHLLLTRPRQIEQFGGGDWLACSRVCSSSLSAFNGCCSLYCLRNSRMREWSISGGAPSVDSAILACYTDMVLYLPKGESKKNYFQLN